MDTETQVVSAAIFGLVVLIALIVVVGPLLLLWALNTLFALSIPYTFWTWLAALVLGFSVRGRVSVKKE